ncbi:hypothetical protein FAF44_46385 [Nonomuraea sp. MG754425]|uniref:hypothetical protein n=1 Tax=Nonomuraea sp. MG754425 TaxID=2570319 RepID=UPI001F30D16C|nr:hypothetical protein [Nonomuraea sp. MG754425]MCF6475731.1 hypothetical protein [Nonomuraea sp. MG754425]
MVRVKPSAADTELLDRLRELGFVVSSAQLERWRHVGVLPPNKRIYLGRGKGSASEYVGDSLEIAEAMAVTTRRGRSVHEAILRIFTVDPRHNDLLEEGLQIPERAIHSSLEWFIREGDQTLDRRIERRIRRSMASPDDAAEIARRLTATHYRDLFRHPPPTSKLRSKVWAPPEPHNINEEASRLSIRFAGDDEPGADLIAELIVSALPEHILDSTGGRFAAKERLASLLAERETADQPPIKLPMLQTMDVTLRFLSEVDIKRIRDARDKLACVSEMGNLYIHAGGSDAAKEMSDRMLNATTESIDANFLFHIALPIASTLAQDAWHRMASLIIMLLTESDRSILSALDSLAFAAMPHRFALNQEF